MAIPGYQNSFMGSPKLKASHCVQVPHLTAIRFEAAEPTDGFGPHIGMAADGSVDGLDASVRGADRLASSGRGPVGAYGPGCGRGGDGWRHAPTCRTPPLVR